MALYTLQKTRMIYAGLLLLLAVFLFYIFAVATKQPWEAGGRLVFAVQSVPGIPSEIRMGLGIDNLVLLTDDGDQRRVTVRTKRIMLEPGSNDLEILLDVTVPVGNYAGIAFTLTSPELRNAWQDDVAPTPISLVGEQVQLTSSFHIEEDVTSAIVLSFETLQAIYTKDEGEVYLPVIQIETRSNPNVVIHEEGVVTIQDGTIEHSATYGMGWDGVMHFNKRAQREEPVATEEVPEDTQLPTVTASSTETEEETLLSSTTESSLLEEEELATTSNENATDELGE